MSAVKMPHLLEPEEQEKDNLTIDQIELPVRSFLVTWLCAGCTAHMCSDMYNE